MHKCARLQMNCTWTNSRREHLFSLELSAIEKLGGSTASQTAASVFPDRSCFSLRLFLTSSRRAPAGRAHSDVVLYEQFARCKSNVHNHRFGSSSVFIFAFLLNYASSLWRAGDYGQSHEQVIFCTPEIEEEKKTWYMVKEEQIEKRQPEWFESKIEIKFTSLLVSFAMCAKRLQYLRHSHYSSRERKRHTLTSASSLRFHNRIIPFHHVHGKSATHNRHRSVNMFS